MINNYSIKILALCIVEKQHKNLGENVVKTFFHKLLAKKIELEYNAIVKFN